MACPDFPVFDLRHQFGAQFRAEQLFPNAAPVAPSEWLRQPIRIGQEVSFNSEKPRSERLVTPVLLELYRPSCKPKIHSRPEYPCYNACFRLWIGNDARRNS
jgi:hypothetical protein